MNPNNNRNSPVPLSGYRTVTDEQHGEYAEVIATLPREAEEKALHTYPLQTVCIEAIDGHLGIMLPDRRVVIRPGQRFQIPRNTGHAFYNADDTEVKFREILKPALHTPWLFDEIKASSQRNRSSIIAFFEKAYILSQVRSEYYQSGIPVFIQRNIYPLIAGIGKLFGWVRNVAPRF